MTTPRRPLHVVPEPGGPSATTSPRAGSTNHQDYTTDEYAETDQERTTMDQTHTSSGNTTGQHESRLVTWLRRVFLDPWHPLVCAVVGLTLDAVLVLVVVHYSRNGVVPTWLDTHGGHWAWLGAGAFAAVVLGELFDNVCRLVWAAGEALDRRHMRAVADRLAAAGLDRPIGATSGGDRR